MSTTSTTIYSGFHRKLKDRRLSWEDRLKIARYAWTTPAAFIPNKHQVLLDWLFGALLNKKKLKIIDRDALYIWLTLNDFVRSNFVRGMASKTQLLSLRSSATQVMTEALTRASLTSPEVDTKLLSWMLGTCHGVLTSSPLAYLLTSRTKVLNTVLSSSLRLLQQMLDEAEKTETAESSLMEVEGSSEQLPQPPARVTPQLKKVVEAFATAAIDAFMRWKGRRGADERLILQFFVDEVMETHLALLLGDRLKYCADGETLRSKLTSLAAAVLYNVDHKIHYEHFLDAVASKSSEKSQPEEATGGDDAADSNGVPAAKVAKPAIPPPLIKAVFDKFRRHISADSSYVASSVMNGLASLDVAASRRFAAAVHLSSDVATTRNGRDVVSAADISVLNAVYRHVAEDDLVDSFDQRAKDRLSSVLNAALSFAAKNPPFAPLFELLVDLLKCDPHVLDPVAAEVVGLTLVGRNRSDSSSDETSKARDAFFAFFIELYKKLRRLDKFFLHLHTAVVEGRKKNEYEDRDVGGMSKAALRTVEEIGVDLPIGTVLTIWENLHEAMSPSFEKAARVESEDRVEGRLGNTLATLMLVEASFLQKLFLANHELPENLSAQIHACVVTMGEIETKIRELTRNLGDDLESCDKYRECVKRLKIMLQFYLPHRHRFVDVGPIEHLTVCAVMENPGPCEVVEAISRAIVVSPANWLPYSKENFKVEYLKVVVKIAVDNVFLSRPSEENFGPGSLAFLKDESNHEIPNFAKELFGSLLELLELGGGDNPVENWEFFNRERIDNLLDLLGSIPHLILGEADLEILITKLFSLVNHRLESGAVDDADDGEKILLFVDALLTDFPKALDRVPVSFEPSADIISLLSKCQRFLLGSPERCERANSVFGRAVISIAVKLVKICFRRETVAPLCAFFESLLTSAAAKNFPDSMIQFLLPLYFVSWHGLQRLKLRSNPADDLKLQRLKLTQVVENVTTYLVQDVFMKEEEELSVSGATSIIKTLVSTRFSNPSTEDNEQIFRKMVKRLVDDIAREPSSLTTDQRKAILDCLVVVLRKPQFVSQLKKEWLSRNQHRNEEFGLEGFILGLLPPLPKSDAVREAPATVDAIPTAPGQLPTETLSILDRFMGGDSGDPIGRDSGDPIGRDGDYPVAEVADETLSDVSKPISAEERPIRALFSSFHDSSASLVHSLLRCMLGLHRIETSANDDSTIRCDVAKTMISLIRVDSIDEDYRRLDLALRFCLDNFDASTSSSKPLSKQSTHFFIEAVQNLAVGLGLRCREATPMSLIERSVASSILLCLSKFLTHDPKRKCQNSAAENCGNDEDPIHLKPMASVAVEVLLALPLPGSKDAGDASSQTASAKYLLRYVDVVNSLFVHHSHRVFSMAPAYFMTVDRSLKMLAGICENLSISSSGSDLLDEETSLIKITRDCANALLRLVTLFRPHKTELSKLAPYWISHFTRALSSTPSFGLDSRVIRDLNSCVFCLMDLMDEFGFDILRTLLLGREKELLQKLKKEYETTFKFKGKI